MRDGVCYNVQISGEARNKIIIAYDITNSRNDLNQLANMSKQSKNILNTNELIVVADTGYYNNQQIKECTDNNITPFVPEPPKTNINMFYGKDKFVYKKNNDIYICPEGNRLEKNGTRIDKGNKYGVYKCKNYKDCRIKQKCTSNKRGRTLQRWEHEELVEKMKLRIQMYPEMMKKRKSIIEHPFGTIKREMNQYYFLTKGFKNVSAEFALTALVYNMKRAINILGINNLIQAIG